jgi:hypothetical protein
VEDRVNVSEPRETQLVKDASDEDQVAYGQQFDKRRRAARADAISLQMATVPGRHFVREVMLGKNDPLVVGPVHVIEGGLYDVYAANAVANEKRRFLEELMRDLPDQYLLMEQEGMARERQTRREIEAARVRKPRRRADETDTPEDAAE